MLRISTTLKPSANEQQRQGLLDIMKKIAKLKLEENYPAHVQLLKPFFANCILIAPTLACGLEFLDASTRKNLEKRLEGFLSFSRVSRRFCSLNDACALGTLRLGSF